MDRRTRLCFRFQRTGTCKFGEDCDYSHDLQGVSSAACSCSGSECSSSVSSEASVYSTASTATGAGDRDSGASSSEGEATSQSESDGGSGDESSQPDQSTEGEATSQSESDGGSGDESSQPDQSSSAGEGDASDSEDQPVVGFSQSARAVEYRIFGPAPVSPGFRSFTPHLAPAGLAPILASDRMLGRLLAPTARVRSLSPVVARGAPASGVSCGDGLQPPPALPPDGLWGGPAGLSPRARIVSCSETTQAGALGDPGGGLLFAKASRRSDPAPAIWGRPGVARGRDAAPTWPDCSPARRDVGWPPGFAPAHGAAAVVALPRPAPAPDESGAPGVTGVLPRPAFAPDARWGGHNLGRWRNGAVPRPEPAPDEPRRVRFAAWS
jgi:hypothetical protein